MLSLFLGFSTFINKFNRLYGHFGTGTLRHQDTSALVPNCPLDTSALVPKCPDTSALFHQCRSVLVPKCPSAEVSGHRADNSCLVAWQHNLTFRKPWITVASSRTTDHLSHHRSSFSVSIRPR